MSQASAPTIPAAVLAAYGLDPASRIEPLQSLINPTFLLAAPEGPRCVVQRLHPVFAAAVNLDIDAITQRLEQRGLTTPRLIPTRAGALWSEQPDGIWRAQTFIAGRTLHFVNSPEQARAAGAAVGRFHGALDGFAHDFRFTREGVHDTRAHLAALEAALQASEQPAAAAPSGVSLDDVRSLGESIAARGSRLPLADIARQPLRLGHGDLKISNLRFAEAASRQAEASPVAAAREGGHGGHEEVVALIDLDTLAHLRLAHELGDALRSWCNPHPEEGPHVALDLELFRAAISGYCSAAPASVDATEMLSCVAGAAAIALELSARFCRDALEDRYFGWDPARFPSRAAHNLARARTQLELCGLVLDQQQALEDAVGAALGSARAG